MLLYTAVGTGVLWGSGCWTPSVNVQHVVSPSRKTGGSAASWVEGRKAISSGWKWLQEAKRAAHSSRGESWAFQPCGTKRWRRSTVGRDTWPAKQTPGAAAVQWRDAEWREIVKSTGSGSPDQNSRHTKKNWVRDFENVVVKICGTGWRAAARVSRENWQNQWRSFIGEADAKVGQTKKGRSHRRLQLSTWTMSNTNG